MSCTCPKPQGIPGRPCKNCGNTLPLGTVSRRDFFKRLSAVPIGAALALDPLAKTIFLPPAGGWPGSWRHIYRTQGIGYALAESVLQSKEHVAARVLSNAYFRRVVEPALRETFENVYARYSAEYAWAFAGVS